jgi:Fe(3+) dicitrate transport protein
VVTIAGTKLGRTPGSAHFISSKQLERQELDDPHAVLAQVPGVYTRGEDGLGLRPNIGIRGVNPDRSKKVTLLEDGLLFGPAPYSAPAAYYFPLMTRMYQVKVIKGPAAIAYGPQTVAGAIDLVTRPVPTETSAYLDIAGGQYAYGKGHGWFGWSDPEGKVGFLVEGVHLRTEGFKELPDDSDTGFYRNEWMVKAFFDPDPSAAVRNELRLKLTFSNEASNETYLGLTDADFEANPDRRYGASKLDRMVNYRTSFVATHVLEPSPDFTITTNVYRHDYARTWRKVNAFRGAAVFDVLRRPEAPANAIYYAVLRGEADSSTTNETILIGPNQREFVNQGIETRARLNVQTGPVAHRIEYGLHLHHDRIDRRHSQDGFLTIAGDLVPDGTPTEVTAYNRESTDAISLHAIDAITWNRFTLTPGVRVEVMQSASLDRATGVETRGKTQAVMPGIGAWVGITEDLGVLAGVYRGYSPPAPGQDDAEPESSTNFEGGARYSKGPARAEAIAFYNDYSNLTDICTLSSGCVEENLDTQFDAGEARVYGLEAYLAHEIPAGKAVRFPVSASYTLTYAEFLNAFQSQDPIFGNVEAGYEIPYVPRHELNLQAGVETDRAGGLVSGSYVAAMREEAGDLPFDESLVTDEQFTMDVGAWVKVLKPLTVYANLRNILDGRFIVSRRPFGARPNAPRWLQIGAKATF